MTDEPREKQKPSLGKWKKLDGNVFEVTAMGHRRAVEVGSKLLNVPFDEVLAKVIRERQRYLSGQAGRKRSRRYRVTLKPIDGVFSLTVDGTAVFLQVDAARHGGRPAIADQVLQELGRWPVTAVDAAVIQGAIEKANWEKVLAARLVVPENAPKHGVAILITEDQMRAYAMARGSAAKSPLDRELFEEALRHAGVVAGILEDDVAAYLAAKNRERPVLVARGQEPIHGDPAGLEWLVPVSLGVDRESVPPVAAGDSLARLKPATAGQPGLTVTGKAIPSNAGAVRELSDLAGEGVVASGDGQLLVAATRGKPAFQADRAVVLLIEEVAAVAGSLETEGHLVVSGPVAAGSQIRANGHVELHRGVQDTVVRAGGSIVLEEGASGKSLLAAGQDVLARFLRGSIVKAGGVVRIGNESVQGTIWAGDRVVVRGRGRIDGGLVRAGREIVAETIGNEEGRATRVVVSETSGDKPARIIAWRRVLPGTIVRIGSAEIEIDEPLGPTVFEFHQGQIRVRPLFGQRPADD